MTNIKTLRRMITAYYVPANAAQFNKAEKYLMKIHAKFGTIQVSTIENLVS